MKLESKRLYLYPISDEEMVSTLALMDNDSKRVVEIPALTKALGVAYDNLRNEQETQLARGGSEITSSMNADEEIL